MLFKMTKLNTLIKERHTLLHDIPLQQKVDFHFNHTKNSLLELHIILYFFGICIHSGTNILHSRMMAASDNTEKTGFFVNER